MYIVYIHMMYVYTQLLAAVFEVTFLLVSNHWRNLKCSPLRASPNAWYMAKRAAGSCWVVTPVQSLRMIYSTLYHSSMRTASFCPFRHCRSPSEIYIWDLQKEDCFEWHADLWTGISLLLVDQRFRSRRPETKRQTTAMAWKLENHFKYIIYRLKSRDIRRSTNMQADEL